MTPEQKTVADTFAQYGITPDQISFDKESVEPIFDFEALSVLALKLGDFPDITISPEKVDAEQGIATSRIVITLPDNKTRSSFASAVIGERLGQNFISDIGTAQSVSRTKCLRVGLRMVGFNPVTAHQQRVNGQVAQLTPHESQRVTQVKEVHALRHELGYGDDSFRELIAAYYQGRRHLTDLGDVELNQFAAILRSLLNGVAQRQAA